MGQAVPGTTSLKPERPADGGAVSFAGDAGSSVDVTLPFVPTEPAYFVSPSGSDTADGTEAHPVRTFLRGSKLATPGSTVYLRGGTYHAQEVISAQGTAEHPITFEPYPGESVRVDGNSLGIAMNRALLLINASSYVTLLGIEVVNSDGRGVDVSASSHVTVQGCTIHEMMWGGLSGESDDMTFDGNEIYDTDLENKNGINADGLWSSGAGSWLKPDGSWVKNYTFTNNYVHDIWGECVIMLFVDTAIVRGNRIRDCWSTNLYLDHVRNVVVEKNFVYTTGSAFNKPSVGAPATGLGLAIEPYVETSAQPLDTIVIRNNLVMNTGLGINFWGKNTNLSALNTYRNVHVENNVVYGTARAAISFDAVAAGAAAPTGCTLRNNVLHAGSLDGVAVWFGNAAGWNLQNNNFPSGVPSMATGNGNFSAFPGYSNPSLAAGPPGFQLQAGSGCIAMGTPSSFVSDDYWATARPSAKPSVGLYEPR